MKTKTQFTNRILSLVLSIMVVVSMLPMSALTASAAETTESAIDLSTLTGTYVISDSGEYTFTGSGSYGIKVESGNPTIVLNNASITVGEGSAIDVASGSNATIFVLGDNSIGTTNTESWDAPCGGIFVAEGGTVNITSNGTDNILRAHGTLAAAIGGKYIYADESYNAGNINISNVTVYAYTNNYFAAAIGAAGEGTCGTINITNAVVYAYGAGDQWSSAPGIGSAWSLVDWPDTIPIVIISDSEVHTFRYNSGSDYIGYMGDIEYNNPDGGPYATGSINCGGGSVTNSTIYCYTGLTATTTDKTVKYGALGGLLKEDGTCEGEHSGGTQTCMGYKCANCANWYGEKNENHDWSGKDGICTNGCGTTHDPHTFENGKCTACGLVCDHSGNTSKPVDNENGTHSFTCTVCQTTVTEEHNFENDAHKCVCGKVETFTVYWASADSLGLENGISTFGQDFVQAITVPENTHLEIEGVYLADDPSVPVNYTYENDVLTIAAADLPAADVCIDCYHYVEVKFDANDGKIKPYDGYPLPGDTGFAEDGSYWIQKFAVGQEIDSFFVNAEVSRTGYNFVEWRDASGKVYPMAIAGNVEPYVLATEDVTLYVQWQCNHTIGGVVFRDNGNGTHNGYCGECDEPLGNYVERPHNFGDNTHKCICGKKITPVVTAPTAKTNLIYDGSEQELINAGSTTGGTLQYSLDNVTWSAEIPTAITVGTHTVYYKVVGNENFEDVAAQSITVTITDKTAPTGTILIKENGWNKFWNTITFGIFCKDYVDVTITADGTGSGVTKVEYLLSGTALEENNIPVDGWTTRNADNGKYSFSIKPQNKVAVYVRITDEGGNVTVINSDGIVVYEDSKAVDTEVTYTYKENSNKDIAVEFNGNTVNSIVCGEKVLAANTDYSVDYESGKIVLTASYLDTLNAGDYTYTVSYDPMGVENSGVTDLTTTFIVKVEPTSINGATVNVSGTFTYDGHAKTPDPVVVLNGETLVKDRDYTVSYAENVNAGTATVTVIGKGNYSGTKTATFSIAPMELDETNTVVTLDQNTFVYDGTEHKPAVTVTFNVATLTEGVDYRVFYSQPMRIVNGKVDKWFGDHTTSVECVNVDGDYYAVVVGLGNFRTKDAFTLYANFVIEKATVIEPTIATKPYTGSEQTADVTDTDLYTVVKNEGGTGVKENGCYDVVLELKDPANYKWSTTDNAQVTLQFKITRAENEWTVDPSITGWTYGEAAKAPVGEAKFGEVSVEYSGTMNGGAAYNGVAAPTEAGSYTATFIVQETEDYKGLETSVDFTIAKADYNMRGAKWNYREPFKYDGKEHKVEVVGLPTGVTVESYENNTATAVGDYYARANLAYDADNYNAPTINVLGWTIYNDWTPTEYTVNGSGWMNRDFVITANDGYKVALTNTADGDWKDALTYSAETADGSVTIYLKNETDGTISLAKTVSYKIDKTVPVGKVEFAERTGWEEFVNTITFGLLYNDEVTVQATANDNLSGVDKIEYASADKAMTLDEVKAITDWTEYTDSFGVTLEDAKTFVYFVRITDKAGNVTYLSTDGAEYDTTAPVIDGVENGKTYYTTQKVTVTEKNVDTITLNGNPATENITLAGNKEATYTIVVTDKAGNTTTVTVTMKPIKALASATENLGNDNVTSDDAPALEELVETLDALLADEDVSDGERETLEQHKHIAESLIDTINDAADATDTENVGKVENVTPENVTPENKTDLENAKADLEKALEDNGGNYTEDEKKAIEDEIKRIDDALEVIGNVEEVEESISRLPAVDTVKLDDEEAIKAITDAQTAYNALSDYEKSLVDEATKAALDKLAAALVAYDIVEGDGSSWTEDSDHNITFVVNGLFSKFVGIKVDGKDVDKANYEVKAGSTIITLKASYLDTLAVGEHTITVVYTDGSTDGTFNVHAKANSPATGDNSNMLLWVALLFISGGAVITLAVVDRKKRMASNR